MAVIIAEKSGFCFGVKRAVEIAINEKSKHKKNIYTLGPLIHNNDVVSFLKGKGIYPIDLKDIDALEKGDVIIIRSHGIAKHDLNVLQNKGFTIVDATCPNVLNIQKKAELYSERGYGIIIIGDSTHPEVIGINGWCGNKAVITKNGNGLMNLPAKVCVLCQTTEKFEDFKNALNKIIELTKEIIIFNTICSSTETRQQCADDLSKKVDAMVVIGSKFSSNTTKLYEICKKNCSDTIHVENSGEIPDNIIKEKNKLKIGVTAGASTPEWIIKEAVLKMSDDEKMEINEQSEQNEQLAFMEQNDRQISVGMITKGEVISVGEKQAFLNIGYKIDGILPLGEVTENENADLNDFLKVGQEIETKVVSRRNEDGYVVLSRIELEREQASKSIRDAKENKTILNVLITQAVNGGLVASYKGVRIFIPASHIELYHVEDLSIYVGKEIDVNIIEIKEERKSTRIVASRRDILKQEKAEKEEETWNTLEKDTIVDGEVKRLTNFGAFVEINGVDGLLHVSEISWGRVEKPGDVLKIGDKIKVYILNVDKENKKVSLSMKKLTEDPWNNADIKYPAGNIVLGKVMRFAPFGAFVQLEPGVDGLVHISQISHNRINKPEDALKIGETVKAKILDVNKDSKKIGLSIKQVDEIELLDHESDQKTHEEQPKQESDEETEQKPDEEPVQQSNPKLDQESDQQPDQKTVQESDPKNDQEPDQE